MEFCFRKKQMLFCTLSSSVNAKESVGSEPVSTWCFIVFVRKVTALLTF